MHSWLPDLLVCPECGGALSLDGANWKGDEIVAGTLSCGASHRYPIVGGVPRFVQHELDADQARSRDSFGYEWTRLYPEHGHQTAERQAERDIFLEDTRTVPSDYRNKLVLDAGCGNGRYAKLANDWGARVVAVDISSAVEIAQRNVGIRETWPWCKRTSSSFRSGRARSRWCIRSACCITRPMRRAPSSASSRW